MYGSSSIFLFFFPCSRSTNTNHALTDCCAWKECLLLIVCMYYVGTEKKIKLYLLLLPLFPFNQYQSCPGMISADHSLALDPHGLPSVDSFFPKLQQCNTERNLPHAHHLHSLTRLYGLDVSDALSNHFIPAFLRCGSVSDALQVFRRLASRNEYSWTSLIHGYIDHGRIEQAFMLLPQMQDDGVCANRYTYPGLLKACSKLKCCLLGREMHTEIIKAGLEDDLYIGNSLIDMYAKSGSFTEACHVFHGLTIRDVVSWNALITGYTELGLSKEALQCLQEMQLTDIPPSIVTYMSGLKACSDLGLLSVGQEIHAEIIREGYESDAFLASSLVDMYAKCSRISEAQDVFEQLQKRDVVVWTAMIDGYAGNGLYELAVKCLDQMQLAGVRPNVISWNSTMMGFAEQGESERAFMFFALMQEQGILPDTVTFVSMLKACGTMAVLQSGKRIHAQLADTGAVLSTDADTAMNAVIDMYCKCGCMTDAQYVFDTLPVQGLREWSSLIAGYVSQGEFQRSFHLLGQLMETGIQLDGVTFLTLLTLCSHSGLVGKVQDCMQNTCVQHKIVLQHTHYNCMIDLVARAGRLEEAVAILRKMPFLPNTVTWSILLGACHKWGNIEYGRSVFDSAILRYEKDAAAFILMSNISMDLQDEALYRRHRSCFGIA